jgi:hypothetical protein
MDAARLTRIGAAVVAFLVVMYIGLGMIGNFSLEAATGSWALVGAIGLVVAIVAYAAVELLQTGGIESLAGQFDTRTVVLMPLAIAVNIIVGAAVANALKIPIYLDSIGTILVGALAGPIPGAMTGFLTNVLWTYVVPPPFQSAPAAAFAIVAAVIGLLAGVFGRIGVLRPRPDRSLGQLLVGGLLALAAVVAFGFLGYLGFVAVVGPAAFAPESANPLFVILAWVALALLAVTVIGLAVLLLWRRDLTAAFVVVAGVATGIIAALISAPISANLFSGVTGAGTDFLVAAFRQAGAEIQAATLGQGLISDPIDKVTTFFVVYLVLQALSRRTVARFPQGEELIEARRTAPEAAG